MEVDLQHWCTLFDIKNYDSSEQQQYEHDDVCKMHVKSTINKISLLKTLQSIPSPLTRHTVDQFGLSLTLAYDDIERAVSSCEHLEQYHLHPQQKTKEQKKTTTKIMISTQKIKTNILTSIIGLCLYHKIEYSQSFFQIALMLGYLIPSPLLNIHIFIQLLDGFCTIACPHLILINSSNLNSKDPCEHQKQLCLLFHQLLQFHYPFISLTIDQLFLTSYWNSDWFDSLCISKFKDPTSWIRFWYFILQRTIHRHPSDSSSSFSTTFPSLNESTKPYNGLTFPTPHQENDLRSLQISRSKNRHTVTSNDFDLYHIYCEYMMMLLAIIQQIRSRKMLFVTHNSLSTDTTNTSTDDVSLNDVSVAYQLFTNKSYSKYSIWDVICGALQEDKFNEVEDPTTCAKKNSDTNKSNQHNATTFSQQEKVKPITRNRDCINFLIQEHWTARLEESYCDLYEKTPDSWFRLVNLIVHAWIKKNQNIVEDNMFNGFEENNNSRLKEWSNKYDRLERAQDTCSALQFQCALHLEANDLLNSIESICGQSHLQFSTPHCLQFIDNRIVNLSNQSISISGNSNSSRQLTTTVSLPSFRVSELVTTTDEGTDKSQFDCESFSRIANESKHVINSSLACIKMSDESLPQDTSTELNLMGATHSESESAKIEEDLLVNQTQVCEYSFPPERPESSSNIFLDPDTSRHTQDPIDVGLSNIKLSIIIVIPITVITTDEVQFNLLLNNIVNDYRENNLINSLIPKLLTTLLVIIPDEMSSLNWISSYNRSLSPSIQLVGVQNMIMVIRSLVNDNQTIVVVSKYSNTQINTWKQVAPAENIIIDGVIQQPHNLVDFYKNSLPYIVQKCSNSNIPYLIVCLDLLHRNLHKSNRNTSYVGDDESIFSSATIITRSQPKEILHNGSSSFSNSFTSSAYTIVESRRNDQPPQGQISELSLESYTNSILPAMKPTVMPQLSTRYLRRVTARRKKSLDNHNQQNENDWKQNEIQRCTSLLYDPRSHVDPKSSCNFCKIDRKHNSNSHSQEQEQSGTLWSWMASFLSSVLTHPTPPKTSVKSTVSSSINFLTSNNQKHTPKLKWRRRVTSNRYETKSIRKARRISSSLNGTVVPSRSLSHEPPSVLGDSLLCSSSSTTFHSFVSPSSLHQPSKKPSNTCQHLPLTFCRFSTTDLDLSPPSGAPTALPPSTASLQSTKKTLLHHLKSNYASYFVMKQRQWAQQQQKNELMAVQQTGEISKPGVSMSTTGKTNISNNVYIGDWTSLNSSSTLNFIAATASSTTVPSNTTTTSVYERPTVRRTAIPSSQCSTMNSSEPFESLSSDWTIYPDDQKTLHHQVQRRPLMCMTKTNRVKRIVLSHLRRRRTQSIK